MVLIFVVVRNNVFCWKGPLKQKKKKQKQVGLGLLCGESAELIREIIKGEGAELIKVVDDESIK